MAPGLKDEFPPLNTLDARPTNLPPQPTPLVGREREIREVAGCSAADVRLVTLTGRAARARRAWRSRLRPSSCDDFADGVFFVDLAPLQDPDAGPARPSRRRSASSRRAASRRASGLGRHLRDRELLLVLDNFEHVLEAAPSSRSSPRPRRREAARDEPAPLRLAARARRIPVPPLERRDGARRRRTRSLRVRVGRAVRRRARARSGRTSPSRPRTRERSPRSARRSTGCRWRSSLPPRASACCRRRRCCQRLDHRCSC